MRKEDLQEGLDYYNEGGYRVFTELYHLKRGYCCGSGCRHCPYGYDKSTGRIKKGIIPPAKTPIKTSTPDKGEVGGE